MEFTKGPWKWEQGWGEAGYTELYQHDAEGKCIRSIVKSCDGCAIIGSNYSEDGSVCTEDEANARLIAAAPEMLEALKMLEAMLSLYSMGCEPKGPAIQKAIESANAVIAKAEGREK